jgi:CubicO group peptidase (beta-lactamase class C family)
MRRRRKGRGRRLLTVGLGLVAALVLAALAAALAIGLPRNAAGMAARSVCSGAFVAGRPWHTVLTDDVLPASPVLRLLGVTVDVAARTVSARFAGGFERRAAHLGLRGCVLDAEPDRAAAPPAALVARRAPWPEGDAPLPPAQWGPRVDAARLQALADEVFVGAGDPAAANARGLAVLHRGRLLVLRHAEGFDATTPLHGWSMTKTVLGMLAHKIAAESGLALDRPVVEAFRPGREPAWAARWRADARERITVQDLLWMRDGLANVEDYAPWGAVPRLLWGGPDVAGRAAAAGAEVPPRTRWRYSSAASNLLARVLRGRFATDPEYWAYARQALFDPIGARTAVLEADADGTWIASSYLWASTADWARLGLVMLQDGRWGARQVLPPGWLARAATSALARGEGLGYGAQTWLVGHPGEGMCRDRGLPPDAMAMLGHWGQLVAVVPSREVVVVRLGWTLDPSAFRPCQLVAEVLGAVGPPGGGGAPPSTRAAGLSEAGWPFSGAPAQRRRPRRGSRGGRTSARPGAPGPASASGTGLAAACR